MRAMSRSIMVADMVVEEVSRTFKRALPRAIMVDRESILGRIVRVIEVVQNRED